jgi:hypothetical protein
MRIGILITLLATLLLGCDPQPAAVVPVTAAEQAAFALAARNVPTDWTVPIEISPGAQGTFRIAYWTPERELELLGPRVVIVTPATQTATIVPRD